MINHARDPYCPGFCIGYVAAVGEDVGAVAATMLQAAELLDTRVICCFNGTELAARPGWTVSQIVHEWDSRRPDYRDAL